MPGKRNAMRKSKHVLRLKFEAKLSHEKIAAATGMSKGAVTNTVQRAAQSGLGWPLPAELDEAGLEALMYRKAAPPDRYAQPEYTVIHQELKRKGVTLPLLWEEYQKAYVQSAHRYSQFCLHYHEYCGRLARSMRQVHPADEKVFIDYSGDTVAVIDAKSGEILTAEIFVATLGASKYAYAEATWTHTLPDWIGSNIWMLEFFGVVPSLWIQSVLTAQCLEGDVVGVFQQEPDELFSAKPLLQVEPRLRDFLNRRALRQVSELQKLLSTWNSDVNSNVSDARVANS
jgi:hypothetical protein